MTALHHVEHGTGTPIVFIHGYTVDHRLLLPLEAAFAERPGWRRIHLDLPGHGRTPASASEPSADAIAETVAATIDELIGADTAFAVCGNSFGGQLARDLVARHGVRVLGLALIAPVVRPRGRRSIPRDARPIDTASAAYRTHAEPGIRNHDREFAARLDQAYDLTTAPEERFTTFDHPSLLLTGRQDDSVGFADQFELLESYPRMTYVALDDAGHNVHLDRPTLTNALFADWLDRLEQAPQRAER